MATLLNVYVSVNVDLAAGTCSFQIEALPAMSRNPEDVMASIFEILMLLLGVARMFIFVHFIMSWLINFDVLNVRQPLVGQIWYGLQRILEPIYRPIRNILPNMGGIDLSPIVALIGIEIIRIILINNIALFY